MRSLAPLLGAVLLACASDPRTSAPVDAGGSVELATFGAGCFWCSEAAFEQLDGVLDVRSGFMGGDPDADPSDPHALIAAGAAEVVRVSFDPARTSYATLLDWFWVVHDPTSLNEQGADEGTEYRSVIFFHSEEQRGTAESSRGAAQEGYEKPIVTAIVAAGPFHAASEEHQDYYRKNRESEYCRTTIAPHLLEVGLRD